MNKIIWNFFLWSITTDTKKKRLKIFFNQFWDELLCLVLYLRWRCLFTPKTGKCFNENMRMRHPTNTNFCPLNMPEKFFRTIKKNLNFRLSNTDVWKSGSLLNESLEWSFFFREKSTNSTFSVSFNTLITGTKQKFS